MAYLQQPERRKVDWKSWISGAVLMRNREIIQARNVGKFFERYSYMTISELSVYSSTEIP
jgi:hypothetical protein